MVGGRWHRIQQEPSCGQDYTRPRNRRVARGASRREARRRGCRVRRDPDARPGLAQDLRTRARQGGCPAARDASRVRAALIDEKTLIANAFKITTERGVVYVQGRATAREIALMTEIVSGMSGVTRVVRLLDVLTEEDLSGMLPAPPSLPK